MVSCKGHTISHPQIQNIGSECVTEIYLLIDWAFQNQQDWLCEEVLLVYTNINEQMIGESLKNK